MKRTNLARTVARKTKQTKAEAQDEIDILVNRILQALREGRPVKLPSPAKPATRKKTK
ncbi:MAG TPA: HU family DNA-binding protein [Bryobacteraceae bacterium]|jgi:nucleoid DNA-binding protein